MPVCFLLSHRRLHRIGALPAAAALLLIATGAALAQPADITFTLRDYSKQALQRQQAGDTTGYRTIITKLRAYIPTVYRPADLDRGWRELASDQLGVGDRAGAKATAQMIKSPRRRADAFVEIASKYKDRAAFADAAQACLQCPTATDLVETIQNVARDEFNKGFKAEAQTTLRAATKRLSKPLANAKEEEHRHYSLKKVVIDQIQYGDPAGAKETAQDIADGEFLALVAVAQYKAGDRAGGQATFNEAIDVAQKTPGDFHPYYLERITYSLLDCGAIPSARDIARIIPATGNNIYGGHREKALTRVVFAQADKGDIAGAKSTAAFHLSRYYLVVSYLRIAADQRARANATAAMQTLSEARQRIIDFPGPGGFGQEDKVNCLNRIAFVQSLWGAQADSRKTIALSVGQANKVKDERSRSDNLKDTYAIQAACGDAGNALAAAQRLPQPFQDQAVTAIRKAAETKKSLRSLLEFECLDPRKTQRP